MARALLLFTLVCGGCSLKKYDPPGSARATTAMLQPRSDFAMVRLADGRVLLAGGFTRMENLYDGMREPEASWTLAAEIYDPRSQTMTATSPMPTPGARSPRGFLLSDGDVIVCGLDGEVFRWSTAAGAWTSVAVTAPPGATAVALADGRILFVGGADGAVSQSTQATIFDPTTAAMTVTTPMHRARVHPIAMTLGDGRALALGGSATGGEIFDPKTAAWTDVPLEPHPVLHASVLADGRVFAVGNGDTALWAEVFDPTSNVWSETGSFSLYGMPVTRRAGNGAVVLGGNYRGSASYFDGTALRPAVDLSDVGPYATSRTLDDGSVLVCGGTTDSATDCFGTGGSCSVSTNACEIFTPP